MSDVEIGNAIIAGIADGDTVLEKMSEIIDHLRLAGFEIVPVGGGVAQRQLERALELLEEAPAAALRALVIEECAKIASAHGFSARQHVRSAMGPKVRQRALAMEEASQAIEKDIRALSAVTSTPGQAIEEAMI